MKPIILISGILFLIMANTTRAQEAETLFSGGVDHGGYGSLVFGVTSVNGQTAYLRGTRGAWVIRFGDGNAIHLGLGGYRTESDFDAVRWREPGLPTSEMSTNYGGFEMEYVNRSYKLVHFGMQALVGSGNIKYLKDADSEKKSDDYFVLQPGANIHLNLTNWFRLSGGVFYRYAANVNLQGTSGSDLSGLSAMVGLRFGKF
jgi:hypothetical protein